MSNRYVPGLWEDEEDLPLAGDVIDLEPIRPPWRGATVIGAVWFWMGVILPPVVGCAARLAYGLPWVAIKSLVALIRRYRWGSSSA